MHKTINQLHKLYHAIGKYTITSIVATIFDLIMFWIVLHKFGFSPISATVVGRLIAAILALLLHQYWVFKNTNQNNTIPLLIIQYAFGIVISLLLNILGVWLFNSVLGILPTPARIISAIIAWYLLYLFYKYVVYNYATPKL